MLVMGSPILGMNFSLSSLILNKEGLFRKVWIPCGLSERIFLTDDMTKILELIEVDFDEYNEKQGPDAYNLLVNSPYYDLEPIIGYPKNNSKAIVEFRAYLINNKIAQVFPPKRVRTERIEAILGIELRDRVDEIKNTLTVFHKERSKKYQGVLILPFLGDYDKRDFSTDMPIFYNSFDSDYEFKKFIVDNTTEEIAKKFLEVKNQ